MTPVMSIFATYEPDSTGIITADGKRINAIGIGTVILPSTPTSSTLVLHNVLHCPDLKFSLISVFRLNEDHLHVAFTEDRHAMITDPFQRTFLITAPWSRSAHAYLLTSVGDAQQALVTALTCAQDEERCDASVDEELAPPPPDGNSIRRSDEPLRILWHERLAHLPESQFPKSAKNSTGLPAALLKRRLVSYLCWLCSYANIRRSPFPRSSTHTTRALELVHADLTGRIITKSLGGAEYLAVLVDDFTRMVWVLPLARKSDFVRAFAQWRDEVVPYKGAIACLRTDGGGEFSSNELQVVLAGARHEKSCAYTSQQNGVAERHVGIIKNIMRTLLHQRSLPIKYWAEAALAAAYIRNRRPCAPIGGRTPFELWHGSQPDVSHLRVFGCLAFAMIPDHARQHSLAPRSRPGVFVGYDKYSKGYRIHFPDSNKVEVVRNVEFHENTAYHFGPSPTSADDALHPDQDLFLGSSPIPPGILPRIASVGPLQSRPPPRFTTFEPAVLAERAELPAAPPAALPPSAPLPAAEASAEANVPAPPRRTRTLPPLQVQTRSHARRLQAGRDQRATAGSVIALTDSFARAYRAQLSTDGVELEPDTLRDAMRRPDWPLWLEAMQQELASHKEMGTWDLEPLPDGHNVVGCRWVFKLKLDAHGNVVKYKARLVAQGFSQVPGIDFDQTYSPVTRFASLRALLALAAYLDWHVHQLDVVTAYLYGRLAEVVYMKQPPHLAAPGQEHLFCRLRRALYGLRQAGRQWYFTLRDALIELGFTPSIVDPSVFIYGSGATAIVVAVYVDDILVLGASLDDIVAFKSKLAKKFRMTDQGQVGHFLGVSLQRDAANKTFFISQASYITSMLAKFDLAGLKPISTPLDCKQRLTPFEGIASADDKTRYQAMVGSLNWLAQASRPDISFAVSVLARHAKNPGPAHFGCVKRVMRYLAGSANLQLRLTASSNQPIVAHSDADFGGDASAKSTSGWCVAVYGATVAWGSKLQSLVADSTAQAEIIAVWQTSREVAAIRHLLLDIGILEDASPLPSIIFCDNQPAIHIITNPVSNGLSRHIERKYLSTRDQQERGIVDVKYISTRTNPADIFTKALPLVTFSSHGTTIGLLPPN